MRLPRTIGQGRAQKVLLQLLAGLFLCLKAQAQYPFVGELAIVVDRMLADPVRPRIYALTTESNTLRVINTDSLQVTKVIPLGPEPWNMALSPDNSTLYIAEKGSAAQGIAVVNLNTLAVTSYLATPDSCLGVAAGADNHFISRQIRTLAITTSQRGLGTISPVMVLAAAGLRSRPTAQR